MRLTASLLRQATGCSAEAAERFAEPIAAACAFYGIDTPRRLAHFLAQIGHESGSLRYTAELWGPTPAQRRYEGRADLGNTQPGDGSRFRGHGLIQTTGRHNHARVRDRLRARFQHLDVPDFEADPEALTEPQWAALSAADYWDDRGLNALADADDVVAVTRKVNGGTNGLADRRQRLARAERALAQAEASWPFKAPVSPATTQPPSVVQPEPAMPMPTLVAALGASLIDVFAPVVREKITKEVARHSDRPEVAEQVAQGVVEVAKQLTGKSDAIEAVAAAKSDPAIVREIEERASADVDTLIPMFDRIAAAEAQAWAAEEASRQAAHERAMAMPPERDQDVFLTRSIVGMVAAMMAGIALLLPLLSWLEVDDTIVSGLAALLTTLAGTVIGKFGTRYDHRYGSSRGSAAKDALVSEIATRQRPAN